MGKKLLLNVLYNIGLVVCIAVSIWGYEHKRYEFIVAAIVVAFIFAVLKVRLHKEMRETFSKSNPKK